MTASAAICPADGIMCNSCHTDLANGKSCEDNNVVVDCGADQNIGHMADMCFTLTVLLDIPYAGEKFLQVKNCSSSMYCSKMENTTCSALVDSSPAGSVKLCKVNCCRGDLCNGGGASPVPGTVLLKTIIP